MKAAVYYETGGPDVFRFEEVPDPAVGPEDVLIEVAAVSIEGGDTLNRLGGDLANVPHIVGYQCAGTVIAVGTTSRGSGTTSCAGLIFSGMICTYIVQRGKSWRSIASYRSR